MGTARFTVFSLVVGCCAVAARAASAPAPSSLSPAATPVNTPGLGVDTDPIPSVRANGIGGAVGTVADDVDAAMHNPAGIGGTGPSPDQNAPWIRKLYFPEISTSANQNAVGLSQSLKKTGASGDAAVGQAVLDDQAGKREYARANASAGIVIGRAMVIPFYDNQIAAVPRADGSGVIDTHYRSTSGVGYGASVRDPSGHIALGYFGTSVTRQDVLGPFTYDQISDSSQRSAAVSADSTTYRGNANNFGALWQAGGDKEWTPSLGLNWKNAGDTHFVATNGSPDEVDKQELDAAFSLSPKLGHVGTLNLVLEVDQLNAGSEAPVHKLHLGSELLLGRLGSYATFGLRAGYTYAGPSAGLSLNFGLIGFEASVYSVDLNPVGGRLVEQRESATVYVNVAEFLISS